MVATLNKQIIMSSRIILALLIYDRLQAGGHGEENSSKDAGTNDHASGMHRHKRREETSMRDIIFRPIECTGDRQPAAVRKRRKLNQKKRKTTDRRGVGTCISSLVACSLQLVLLIIEWWSRNIRCWYKQLRAQNMRRENEFVYLPLKAREKKSYKVQILF